MAFSERIREWWMRVGNYKCQYVYYDDKKGWKVCSAPAEQVHHVEGDAYLKEKGIEPNNAVGLPLCKNHHIGYDNNQTNALPFEKLFSFHPDAEISRRDYRFWKESVEYFGLSKVGPSPYKEMTKEHIRMSKQGTTYWATNKTPEVDIYLIERMSILAFLYVTRNPNDKRPLYERRPPLKRKHWVDYVYPQT